MERRHLIILGGTVLVLCFLIPLALPIWFANHRVVHVVLVAGDENVKGFASIKNLQQFMTNRTTILQDPSIGEKEEERLQRYASLKDPQTGNWTTRDDVFVFYERQRHAPWSIGPLNIYDYGSGPGLFGPDYEIGHVLGETFPDEPVVIVKAGFKGQTLAKDWRSPSRVSQKENHVLGYAWVHTLANLKYTLNHITKVLPRKYKKHRTQLTGIIWWHGYDDAFDRKQPNLLESYEHNLDLLLKDFRTALQRPHLPIVIAEAGAGGHSPMTPYEMPLRNAQKHVCEANDPETTRCVATSPFQQPHVTQHNDHDYRYYGCGNCMIEIGSVLGSALVELYYKQYEDEERQQEMEADYDVLIDDEEAGWVAFLLGGVVLAVMVILLVRRNAGLEQEWNWNRLFFVSSAASRRAMMGDGIFRDDKERVDEESLRSRKRTIRFADEASNETNANNSAVEMTDQRNNDNNHTAAGGYRDNPEEDHDGNGASEGESSESSDCSEIG